MDISQDQTGSTGNDKQNLKPPNLRVAQWIEHRPSKPTVVGSTPTTEAKSSLDNAYRFLLAYRYE